MSDSTYEKLSNILLINLILTILLFSIIILMAGFWIWSQIQGIRSDLRKNHEISKIFPAPHTSDKSVVTPPSVPSPKPSSLLSKSTIDFVTAKSNLDKKVFAVSGNNMKQSAGGLKDLI